MTRGPNIARGVSKGAVRARAEGPHTSVRPESARASLVAEGMDAARPHMERIEELQAENVRLRALLMAARFSLQALIDQLGTHTVRRGW